MKDDPQRGREAGPEAEGLRSQQGVGAGLGAYKARATSKTVSKNGLGH